MARLFPARCHFSSALTILFGLSLSTLAAMAQPNPADMVSGTFAGDAMAGDPPITTILFAVPGGKTLVLTDFEYSFIWTNEFTGNVIKNNVLIQQGSVTRWGSHAVGFTSVAAGTEGRDMIHQSFSTGLAFPSGSVVQVFHEPGVAIANTIVSWRISWQGYLTPPSTMGVNSSSLPTHPQLELGQSVPNPFAESTTITFALVEPGQVTLRIVDATGRVVRTLSDGPQAAGNHQLSWDARDDEGRHVSSGVYFVDLLTQDQRRTQKTILIQ